MAVNQKTNQTKHTVRNAGIGRSLASKGILGTCKYLFLLLIILISIGPIIWAFLSSFKTYAEINASAISLPKSFNLNNYADAFRYAPIQKYFLYYHCRNQCCCDGLLCGDVCVYCCKI